MNIVIDPYMLKLTDEKEIIDNIDFFQLLIFLCKNKNASILLYKGLIEKILARNINPFPIYLDKIKDSIFKRKA